MRIPLELPPGLFSDGTSHAEGGRWGDGSNVRFNDEGEPETIKGWESLTTTALTGVCRAAYPWTDNANTLNIALGTHSALQVWIAGKLVTITPTGLAAGQIDGTGTIGYGTGAYGIGGYGSPSATDYFPRTWSFGSYGQELIANPRGGKIYNWTNDPLTVAAVLTNAPIVVGTVDISHTDQVFAFACNEETSGVFNYSCIRHSGVRAKTIWTTSPSTTSQEYILPGGARIVRGKCVGSYILVWTQDSLFLGSYVGALGQIWRFDRIRKGAGLIGPNAFAIDGQTAYWITPDRQFMAYTIGGAPEALVCPIRNDFADNLAASQADKIVGSTINEQKEVRFDYPDARDGYENSRYVAAKVAGPVAGTWYRGIMARTAMVDAGPSSYPCGVTYAGAAYWHERGSTADGGAISAFIKTADIKLDDNTGMFVKEVWPDFKDQQGAVSITITSRFKPQGPETYSAAYMVTADDDKVDVSAKGVYFNIQYAVNSSPAKFRIGVPVLNATPSGRR